MSMSAFHSLASLCAFQFLSHEYFTTDQYAQNISHPLILPRLSQITDSIIALSVVVVFFFFTKLGSALSEKNLEVTLEPVYATSNRRLQLANKTN